MVSILLLLVVFYLAYRVAPRERAEDAHVHGAGQVGLAAAVALFGVDYFTSYYYATGEMLHALHPYGLQDRALIAVASWAESVVNVRLEADWAALGLDPGKTVFHAPEIEGFKGRAIQTERTFRPDEPLPVAPGKGWLLIAGNA